jgi:chemotaxis protein MotB
MVDVGRPVTTRRIGVVALVGVGLLTGCAVVPRSRLEETHHLAQSLRAENDRLKDQVLTLQVQYRDYADRALDDLRRLTAREEAIERLERSIQAYQEDRDRLGDAYHRLAMSLGRPADDGRADSAKAPTVPRATRHAAERADLRGRDAGGSGLGEDRGGP